MTVKVEMSNWITAHDGTDFTVELQAVPLVGEEMLIHKDVLPETYKDGSYDISFDEFDGCVEVIVCGIYHTVTKEGHEIHVGFDFKEYW